MPIYEYQVKEGYEGCTYCKKSFEIMQKITESPLEKCVKCESPVKKVISAPNFQVHGYNAKNRYSNEEPVSKANTD